MQQATRSIFSGHHQQNTTKSVNSDLNLQVILMQSENSKTFFILIARTLLNRKLFSQVGRILTDMCQVSTSKIKDLVFKSRRLTIIVETRLTSPTYHLGHFNRF